MGHETQNKDCQNSAATENTDNRCRWPFACPAMDRLIPFCRRGISKAHYRLQWPRFKRSLTAKMALLRMTCNSNDYARPDMPRQNISIFSGTKEICTDGNPSGRASLTSATSGMSKPSTISTSCSRSPRKFRWMILAGMPP